MSPLSGRQGAEERLSLAEARTALRQVEEETRRHAVATVAAAAGEEAALLDLLIEAMGDSSWRVRKEAAARAAQSGAPAQAAQALVTALAEPDDVGRRNAVIEALVALGEHAVPALLHSLAPLLDHRKLVVDALGLIGDLRGGPALVPYLEDEDANVRVAAAEALGRIGGSAAKQALGRALLRGELLLSQAALEGLNRLAARLEPRTLEPLLVHPTLRAAALTALGRTGEKSALGVLLPALSDPARSTREAAIGALGELYRRLDSIGRELLSAELAGRSEATPALTAALIEASVQTRREAAFLLGLSGRGEVARPLLLALGDPELREAALQALSLMGRGAAERLLSLAPELEGALRAEVYSLLPRLGPATATTSSRLVEALEDESLDAAAAAALALGQLGDKEALAPLFSALERDEVVAQAAAAALGRLGARHYEAVRALVQGRGLQGAEAPHLCRTLGALGRAEDAPALLHALGADAAPVRRAAAEALAQLPSAAEVDEALIFALADEVPLVRAAAARALGAHRSPRAQEALERAAEEGEPLVQVAAAWALGQVALDDPAARPRLRQLVDEGGVAALPALDALGQLGEPEDDARLLAALAGADGELRKAAAGALAARAAVAPTEVRQRMVAALTVALADRHWDVRQRAALALARLGELEPLRARRAVEEDASVLSIFDSALAGGAQGGDGGAGGRR